MRKRRQKIITGLDVGTTKICAIIGQSDEGQLTILGMGSNPSDGLKRGMVVDIDATIDSIQKAVRKAEQQAGVRVRDVIVGIAGGHITSQNGVGMIEVRNPIRGVTEQDRQRAIERARQINIAKDMEILHDYPQEFICDGQPGYRNPIGVSCSTLEARVHIVLASMTSVSNIVKCIKHAGLRVGDILLESLASSLPILSDNERDLGVMLIDIGGGTSDLAVFTRGMIKLSGVIPLGGDNITNDIAYLLKISRHDAENVKKKYARALADSADSDETIEVSGVLKNRPVSTKLQFLCEITEARLEEIFIKARKMIDAVELRDRINAGTVLTGGTSLLPNIDMLAERIFDKPAKVGAPQGLKGMSGIVQSPIYSTGIGLVLHGLSGESSNKYYSNGNIFRKFSHYVQNFIDWYS